VTFLFTDVEGSTQLLRELGDRYAAVLFAHRRALREAIAAHGGVEVDTQGDAVFAAFSRAADAVAAAIAGQRSLAGGPIRVRMGLHTGEPTLTDEGYVGIDLHRAARIAACGHGGQVLLSATTRELVDSPRDLRDLGEHRLKDLGAPERIYQLGEGDFPPLKSLNQTNLPASPNALVDREGVLADIVRLIRAETFRAVTLTGPGGIGKTRVALQAAAEVAGDFVDGVWFVDLAPIRDLDLVVPSIASVLAVKTDLSDHLRSRRTLLLLDNLEQLAAVGPKLAELLRTAPKLKLLVTSRVPMHIVPEQEYAVPPLPHDEAVVLFTERARARRPRFEPDGHVDEICRRLDGLPLAIELAAARAKILSPAQLLERLEQRLPLLTGGARDLPARQRTLRATIEWSYELLDQGERELFAGLAVFAGGWTLEAAERICDADLDQLQSLVDQSLVREREGRFEMLETIREFALERLAAGDEPDALRRRHALHFLQLAEAAEPELTRKDQAVWFARLAAEDANLRAALTWACTAGDGNVAVRFVGTLWRFWWTRGGAGEAKNWAEAALAAGADEAPELRARALYTLGQLEWNRREWEQARVALEQAEQLFRRANATEGVLQVLSDLCVVCANLGDLEGASRLNEEGRELAHAAGDVRRVGVFNAIAGCNALLEGDNELATSLFETALTSFDSCGDASATARALESLALAALRRGDPRDAGRRVAQALTLARPVGDNRLIAHALPIAAAVVVAREPAVAARLLGSADAVRRALEVPLEHLEREVAGEAEVRARNALSDAAFSAAWTDGEALDVEEAVDIALAELEPVEQSPPA
jgi:predicted ATPase